MNPLGLFEGFGIEIEYMIADVDTLDIRPIADRLLSVLSGIENAGDATLGGGIGMSNELVLHLIELKNEDPRVSLASLPAAFLAAVRRTNEALAPLNCRLLPTGMHPWMKPASEAMLWPHDYHEVYETYDRIFDCKRHGWANLQSTHINLPFSDDDEFARLHAAARLVLPLIPGIAASTPLFESKLTPFANNRLEVYRSNAAKLPRVTGHLVPEAIFDIDEYHEKILEPLYRDIARLDEDGILQHEWLNARGAIARFDRDAIEIRLVDCQETPRADIAVTTAVVAVVRALCEGRWTGQDKQRSFAPDRLYELLMHGARDAERTMVSDADYLAVLGRKGRTQMTMGQIWSELVAELVPAADPLRPTIDHILGKGTLSTRISRRLGAGELGRGRIQELYRGLADCLANDRLLDE